MILGTHNTMTYRSPKKWWLYPFKFISQCQSVNYKKQHEKYGVGAFDLRIFWDKKGNIEFRHGAISYNAKDFWDIVDYIVKNNITARILFEERNFKALISRSKKMNLQEKFIELCKEIDAKYPGNRFYGGRNTRTWEVLYQFKTKDPVELGYYSSVTSLFDSESKFLKIIDDWCPRIYALLKNKKNKVYIKENKRKKGIIHFDFVNIGKII